MTLQLLQLDKGHVFFSGYRDPAEAQSVSQYEMPTVVHVAQYQQSMKNRAEGSSRNFGRFTQVRVILVDKIVCIIIGTTQLISGHYNCPPGASVDRRSAWSYQSLFFRDLVNNQPKISQPVIPSYLIHPPPQ